MGHSQLQKADACSENRRDQWKLPKFLEANKASCSSKRLPILTQTKPTSPCVCTRAHKERFPPTELAVAVLQNIQSAKWELRQSHLPMKAAAPASTSSFTAERLRTGNSSSRRSTSRPVLKYTGISRPATPRAAPHRPLQRPMRARPAATAWPQARCARPPPTRGRQMQPTPNT